MGSLQQEKFDINHMGYIDHLDEAKLQAKLASDRVVSSSRDFNAVDTGSAHLNTETLISSLKSRLERIIVFKISGSDTSSGTRMDTGTNTAHKGDAQKRHQVHIVDMYGLSDLLLGTQISLIEQTPLRWAVESASPIVGSGKGPGGGTLASFLGFTRPRSFLVSPIFRTPSESNKYDAEPILWGLLYVDNGANALPAETSSFIFSWLQNYLVFENPSRNVEVDTPIAPVIAPPAVKDESKRKLKSDLYARVDLTNTVNTTSTEGLGLPTLMPRRDLHNGTTPRNKYKKLVAEFLSEVSEEQTKESLVPALSQLKVQTLPAYTDSAERFVVFEPGRRDSKGSPLSPALSRADFLTPSKQDDGEKKEALAKIQSVKITETPALPEASLSEVSDHVLPPPAVIVATKKDEVDKAHLASISIPSTERQTTHLVEDISANFDLFDLGAELEKEIRGAEAFVEQDVKQGVSTSPVFAQLTNGEPRKSSRGGVVAGLDPWLQNWSVPPALSHIKTSNVKTVSVKKAVTKEISPALKFSSSLAVERVLSPAVVDLPKHDSGKPEFTKSLPTLKGRPTLTDKPLSAFVEIKGYATVGVSKENLDSSTYNTKDRSLTKNTIQDTCSIPTKDDALTAMTPVVAIKAGSLEYIKEVVTSTHRSLPKSLLKKRRLQKQTQKKIQEQKKKWQLKGEEQQVAHRLTKRSRPTLFSWVTATVAAAVLILAVLFYVTHRPLNHEQESIRFSIHPSENLPAVAARLTKLGLVQHAKIFLLWSRLKEADRSMRFGEFELKTGQWPWELVNNLQHSVLIQHEITLPEGLNLKQIANLVEDATKVSGVAGIAAKDFISAASEPKLLSTFGIKAKSAEGFLFPETYIFDPHMSADAIVKMMIEQFFSEVKTLNYTPFSSQQEFVEKVILASIIQAESALTSEMGMISGVFQNRLERDMRLESCATVNYILDRDRKERLSLEDIRTESPFNTYLQKGLPPAPIANPGKDALRAAFAPKSHDYLFFVAKEDGSKKHIFSTNFEEHQRAQKRVRHRR